MIDNINEELKEGTGTLAIKYGVDTMAERGSYTPQKDHKGNYESNPKFRLINPVKSEIRKVSKIILDDINTCIRSTTNINQWKNSASVIEWFQYLNDKSINGQFKMKFLEILDNENEIAGKNLLKIQKFG